jgi:hypothetical protein
MREPPSSQRHRAARNTASDQDDGFLLESGPLLWDRRLSVGQKLRRGAVALGMVGLVAFLVFGGPAALADVLMRARAAPVRVTTPPPSLAGYMQAGVNVHLPPESSQFSQLSVSPANDPAGTAYACWITRDPYAPDARGLLHVARVQLGSGAWTISTPPERQAAACGVVADSVDAARLLLYFMPGGRSIDNCDLPIAYESADAGRSWSQLHWPHPGAQMCALSLYLVAGDLYAWGDAPLLPARLVPPESAGQLIWSRDAGASWHVADSGLRSAGDLGVVAFRPGGHMLVQTTSSTGRGELFESADHGGHWRSLGMLPGLRPMVYASSDPAVTTHGGWGPLYLVGLSQGQAAPGTMQYLATAYPGERWIAFTPPTDASAHSGSGLVSLLGANVGPSDMLLASSYAPQTNVTQRSSQRYIWIWNPSRGSWSRAHFLLPTGAVVQGFSWYRGSLRIWVLLLGQTSPQQGGELETFLVPPNVS